MMTHGRLAYCLVAALAAFTSACNSSPTCTAPDVSCSSTCVNPNTDSSNCGVCGKTCATGQACVSGACKVTCATGSTLCGATCTSLQTDNANCGTCGNACASGELCSAGTCGVGCTTGTTLCTADGGSGCANLQNDSSDCGTCGKACPTGELCSKGVCALTCVSGELDCNGVCINPKSDPQNCGGCAGDGGVACPTGDTCNGAGTCASTCPTGQTLCSGVCTSTNSDPSNCGGCAGAGGAVCSTGEICNGSGVCASSCLTGQTLCNGVCTSTNTDSHNCGGCAGDGGVACPTGEICNGSGTCAATCLTGEALCNGLCTNTNTDPLNCGGCAGDGGMACPSGQLCNGSGACATTCIVSEAFCNGTCSNELSDPQNCGTCGNKCDPGSTCSAGTCACENGSYIDCNAGGLACSTSHGATAVSDTDCATTTPGFACTNKLTDLDNCGACGVACTAAAPLCSPTGCTATCPGTASTVCGGSCVNTLTDNSNCGACGQICDPGSTCNGAGKCVCASNADGLETDCTTNDTAAAACNGDGGTSDCGGAYACTDIEVDPLNCNGCGIQCGVSAGTVGKPLCQAGACVVGCGGGSTACPASAAPNPTSPYCANTNTDNANCGACGQICDTGSTCNGAGVCVCASNVDGLETDCTTDDTALVACNGDGGTSDCGSPYACTDTQTDALNCNGCGIQCGVSAGTVGKPLCQGGQCVVGCGGGSTACPADPPTNPAAPYCANTSTDNANCGGCGLICDPGSTCNGSGKCVCASSAGGLETDCTIDDTSSVPCSGGDAGTNDCGSPYACTDLQTDPLNCNGCGIHCGVTAGTVGMPFCQGGACVVGCGGGTTACPADPPINPAAPYCANTDTNSANCGACGQICDPGSTCNGSGVCVCATNADGPEIDCSSNDTALSACSGPAGSDCGSPYACTDTKSDPNNCNGCGNVCTGGACLDGACICPGNSPTPDFCPAPGPIATAGSATNGFCVNGQTNDSYCGNGCTNCTLTANPTCCGGACKNTLTDSSNCGGCGTTTPADICAAGSACSSGVCCPTADPTACGIDSLVWQSSTSSGSASVSAASGGPGSEVFKYNDSSTDMYHTNQTFTFQAVATQSGTLNYSWQYSGFHAYFQAQAGLTAFSGANATTLVSERPAAGGFSYGGTSSLLLVAGQPFGFTAVGQNYDSDHQLIGTITLTSTPVCTNTQTDNGNCGACGTACSGATTCTSGTCQ